MAEKPERERESLEAWTSATVLPAITSQNRDKLKLFKNSPNCSHYQNLKIWQHCFHTTKLTASKLTHHGMWKLYVVTALSVFFYIFYNPVTTTTNLYRNCSRCVALERSFLFLSAGETIHTHIIITSPSWQFFCDSFGSVANNYKIEQI